MVGGTSITAAIGMRTTVSLRAWEGPPAAILLSADTGRRTTRTIEAAALREGTGHSSLDYLQAAVSVAARTRKLSVPLHVASSTCLPVKSGVSSSAAVLLAALGALLPDVAATNLDALVEMAYEIEHEILCTGAGRMDFRACGYGGIQQIDASSPFHHDLDIAVPDIVVLIVDTQSPHGTRRFVASKRERFAAGDPALRTYVREASALVTFLRDAIPAFERNSKSISAALFTAHELLARLVGCSTPLLDECVRLSRQAGALGAKLTGSGYGGCMFALADASAADRIAERLGHLPVRIHHTSISPAGLRYEPVPRHPASASQG